MPLIKETDASPGGAPPVVSAEPAVTATSNAFITPVVAPVLPCRRGLEQNDVCTAAGMNMSVDEIAALPCLPCRAWALTFTTIDWTCPQARAVVRSVNVPEAGAQGQAVQAKLMPPPKKKRGKRVPKPVCPDTALKPYFPNLFTVFADEPVAEAQEAEGQPTAASILTSHED